MPRDTDPHGLVSTRVALVQDAVVVVLRRMDALPQGTVLGRLRLGAARCLREAHEWTVTPPIAEEVERVMKRALALHLAVTKLEKDHQASVRHAN